jgi:hypothetical protein
VFADSIETMHLFTIASRRGKNQSQELCEMKKPIGEGRRRIIGYRDNIGKGSHAPARRHLEHAAVV